MRTRNREYRARLARAGHACLRRPFLPGPIPWASSSPHPGGALAGAIHTPVSTQRRAQSLEQRDGGLLRAQGPGDPSPLGGPLVQSVALERLALAQFVLHLPVKYAHHFLDQDVASSALGLG